ncbi:MAG: hypothetical protein ACREPQ_14905 [Rhodanobacter sp.]
MALEKWGGTSPFGLLRYAEDYRRAAEALHASEPSSFAPPKYSLIGQSIELSLKAFIRSRGVPIEHFGKKKMKLGHDLAELLENAKHRRLDRIVELWSDEESTILAINEPYRDHLFRYIKNGAMSLPNWNDLMMVASHLTKGLHNHCLRSTLGAPVGKATAIARKSCF